MTTHSRGGRLLLAALALAAIGAGLLSGQQGRAHAEEAEPFEIVAAPQLTWGFKTSWRQYAGLPQVGDGAALSGTYNLEWPFRSGSYDAASGETRVEYGGTVRWRKYRASDLGWPQPHGYEGEPDPYILDVTLSDPRIEIDDDGSALTVVVRSRDRDTWEMVDYGRVPLVELDVLGVAPTVEAGTTLWSGVGATVSDVGSQALGGYYRAGQAVDAVEFAYTGPGGAPDFSEHWDEQGAARLELAQNELFVDGEVKVGLEMPPWVDRENLIVHSARQATVEGELSMRYEAFDLKEMRTSGEPLTLPYVEAPLTPNIVAYDTNRNRLLYRGFFDTGLTRWLRYDAEEESYEAGTFADPQLSEVSFIGAANRKLAWDPTRERAWRVERVVPEGVEADDYDNHEWMLVTYRESDGGTWVKESLTVPGFGAGQNRTGYHEFHRFEVPRYATASDGSLIVLATARTSTEPSNPVPATIPAAYRLLIDDAGDSVEVQPLPVQVPGEGGAADYFHSVQTSANGHLLLIKQSGPVVHCKIDSPAPPFCDEPVSVSDNVETTANDVWRFAVDPADGTVWYGGVVSRQLAAIRGGEFLGGEVFQERHPRGGPVLVGDDHTVYAQTNDGSPGETGGSKTWGYGRFERLGFVPTVVSHPTDEAASLDAAEQSEPATFGSEASGDPVPSRQWQAKPPGASTFEDVEGETGTTLTVEAGRGMDGSRYRAVYENDVGRVVSQAATLSVDYAPQVTVDPAGATVTEGVEAEFSVLADANPEPEVFWQRRVQGFWRKIDPEDDNFEVEGASLRVLFTNTEQSGSLFRAKLVNPAGTAFSAPARLTVEPHFEIPAGGLRLEGVTLNWTGNEELQKAPPFGGSNYFSAGASDGTESTYEARSGEARILHVSPDGAESPATWSTRAAHVAGDDVQLARLHGGEGRIEPNGSATVSWQGAFSVNFYGGLVPFTFSDPQLEVDPGGVGTLSADMLGCESSQAEPERCEPFPPVADVVVATFSGVQLEPGGELELEPDYEGVEVTPPVPFAPQEREAAGWGAWPQPFVDFHGRTGLASYWYSSASAFDPYKPPHAFTVDFDGRGVPPEESGEEPGGEEEGGSDPRSGAEPSAASPARRPLLRRTGRRRGAIVRRDGVAVLLRVGCPGPGHCRLRTGHFARLHVGSRRYRARAIAPRAVLAGRWAVVRLVLPPPARQALRGRRARAALWIAVRCGEQRTARRVSAVLRGPQPSRRARSQPRSRPAAKPRR